MKKVGIITFHFPNNFGAVLQAYALSEIIRNFKIDVEIINFVPKQLEGSYPHFFNLRYSLKQNGIISTIQKLMSEIYIYRTKELRHKNFQRFRIKYLKITNKKYKDSMELLNEKPIYDYYICGSDQVWNPHFFLRIGYSYFLDFSNKEGKKISYAASVAQIDEKYGKIFQENLKRFDQISVREASAKEFISKYTDKDIHITLDPTFLIDKEKWNKMATSNKKREKYILVYDLLKNSLIISIANRIAKESGCKIISFSNKKGYENENWLRSFSTDNPTDFVGLFKSAEFIISSSYHGTVFSIIFNKPFYAIPHPTSGRRIIDLLNELGLEERILANINDLNDIDKNINYDKINMKLSKMREESSTFLKNALEIGETYENEKLFL